MLKQKKNLLRYSRLMIAILWWYVHNFTHLEKAYAMDVDSSVFALR